MLYFAYVHSHLLYGYIIWRNGPQYLLNTIIIIQKRFLRIIYRLPFRASVTNRFYNDKFLNINQLKKLAIAIYLRKHYHENEF